VVDPFAEADEDTGQVQQSQQYIHIRIQRMFKSLLPGKRILISYLERNGRKTLTTVQGIPKKFDQKKILKVIKKKFGMTSHSTNGFPDCD
jgi:translation initiation factor 1 (eIF-1/SUI1)